MVGYFVPEAGEQSEFDVGWQGNPGLFVGSIALPEMDTPASLPSPASPTPDPSSLRPRSPRAAQVALCVFLAATLGLLAFRGYGGLGARPTESGRIVALDLNRAEAAELSQVPGIGPTLAREIADDRLHRGEFRSVEELRRVKGVGPATLDRARAFLRVEPPPMLSPTTDAEPLEPLILERRSTQPLPAAPYPRPGGNQRKFQPGDPPIDVNTASIEDLMRLPGIGPVTAQSIVAARATRPFRSPADLDTVKGIGPKTLEKLRPFIVVK
jgi:competence protein ComEA